MYNYLNYLILLKSKNEKFTLSVRICGGSNLLFLMTLTFDLW